MVRMKVSENTEASASMPASNKKRTARRRGQEGWSLTDEEADSLLKAHVLLLEFKKLIDLHGAEAVARVANVAVDKELDELRRRQRGRRHIDALPHLQEMSELLDKNPEMKARQAADRVAKKYAEQFPMTEQDSLSRRLQLRYREMEEYGRVFRQALKQSKPD